MEYQNERIKALDILRGLTIILMIIVNDPGSWDSVYSPLLHASWNGFTPTDFVFPNFVFIVGVSIVLAFNKTMQYGAPSSQLVKKTFIRTLKIYALGVFLWVFPEFDFSRIRWVGVLQRIALVYFVCALLFIYFRQLRFLWVASGLVLFYWVIMVAIPMPGIGFSDLSAPEMNWAHLIDSFIVPGHLYQTTWDPEGFFSTLPAIATGIFGMVAGQELLKKRTMEQKLVTLFVYGTLLFFAGVIISWTFPINKNLWSSSFTCLTAGLSTLLLALAIYVIDVLKKERFLSIAHYFGMNSIFAYALSSILVSVFYSDRFLGVRLNGLFMDSLTAIGLSDKFVSLLYALLYVGIILIPTYILYRKKIFLKL